MTKLSDDLREVVDTVEQLADISESLHVIMTAHEVALATTVPGTPQHTVSKGALLALFEVLDHAGVDLSPRGLELRGRLFPWYEEVTFTPEATLPGPGDEPAKFGIADIFNGQEGNGPGDGGTGFRPAANYRREGDEFVVDFTNEHGTTGTLRAEMLADVPVDDHELAIEMAALVDVPEQYVRAA